MHSSEIGEREPAGNQGGGRIRNYDLSAVRTGPDTSARNDRRSDVIVITAKNGLTRVDCHPHRQPVECGQQSDLRIDRRGHRIGRPRERSHDAIAFTLFNRTDAAVPRDHLFQDLIVLRDPVTHTFRFRRP